MRDQNDWIETHGSINLRRMLRENMDVEELYTEEFAAWQQGKLLAERPQWIVVDPSLIIQPRRPGQRAWAILNAARRLDRSAKLGLYNGSYVAVSDFDGKTIIWPGDEF